MHWDTVKKAALVVVVVFAIAAINVFASSHTEKVMEAGSRYTKCVEEHYGTTPGAWREAHGTYPTCDISQ